MPGHRTGTRHRRVQGEDDPQRPEAGRVAEGEHIVSNASAATADSLSSFVDAGGASPWRGRGQADRFAGPQLGSPVGGLLGEDRDDGVAAGHGVVGEEDHRLAAGR